MPIIAGLLLILNHWDITHIHSTFLATFGSYINEKYSPDVELSFSINFSLRACLSDFFLEFAMFCFVFFLKLFISLFLYCISE